MLAWSYTRPRLVSVCHPRQRQITQCCNVIYKIMPFCGGMSPRWPLSSVLCAQPRSLHSFTTLWPSAQAPGELSLPPCPWPTFVVVTIEERGDIGVDVWTASLPCSDLPRGKMSFAVGSAINPWSSAKCIGERGLIEDTIWVGHVARAGLNYSVSPHSQALPAKGILTP